MRNDASTGRLETLLATLWKERRLLEHLLFKLTAAQLILRTDQSRFVVAAVSEVDRVLTALRVAERHRQSEIAALASLWSCRSEDLSLAALTTRAPSGLAPLFADHRDAFLELADQIDEVTCENQRLASLALSQVQISLAPLIELDSGYSPIGSSQVATLPPRRLDEIL